VGEKGGPTDPLWTGTSYREYELWHERYPGVLTALEEDFAGAMAARRSEGSRVLALAELGPFPGRTSGDGEPTVALSPAPLGPYAVAELPGKAGMDGSEV
jgi:hypothetical protein